MSASVTVSIADDNNGIRSGMARVRKVERLQEDVVESQSERDARGVVEVSHAGLWQDAADSPTRLRLTAY
jgi:hypothetical protein